MSTEEVADDRRRRTNDEIATDVRRIRHAEAQRRSEENRRSIGLPRRDDLTRAVFEALRGLTAGDQIVNIGGGTTTAVIKRLFNDAVAILVAKGFNERLSRRRLIIALLPKPKTVSSAADETDGLSPGM